MVDQLQQEMAQRGYAAALAAMQQSGTLGNWSSQLSVPEVADNVDRSNL